MRKFYSILALCCAAALFAGCEKEQDNLEVVDGLPASLDIVIDLGRSRDVVMTKGIYDYESEINELMLIMFSEKGRKMVLKFGASDLKDVSTSSPTLGGQRLYELAAPVTQDYYGQPVLSGTYEVYAVANWSSPFCGLEENDLVAMYKDALAAAFASNASFATGVTGSQKFPMTGYVAGQKVVPAAEVSETNKTSIKVVLTRLISHIEFNFVNGQSQVAGVNENPQFIPHSYSVYNLPKNAFMMSRKTDIAPEGNIFDGNEYGNVKDIEVTGSGGIEFFMLENVQAAGASTTYETRDVWTGAKGAAPEDKTWTNAPANSTFIVVKGEYTGASYIG
ncbi:MAG: fimbrial protein, partial [Candidatus Cryptobacteroides sp.]